MIRPAALFLPLFLVLAWASPARALEGLAKGGEAVVASVVDGDTVVLDRRIDDAEQVRLTGIQAPKLPLGRPGFQAWPLAEEAKDMLESIVRGEPVTPYFGGARRDRHGRILAHLVGPGGTWLQGEMLFRGLARVYTFPDNRARAAEMLRLERRARNAGRGIWSHPFYAVRPPDPARLVRDLDTFQIIEGRVLDAAEVRGVVYLNFGLNWRTDFTVRLDRKTARLFRREGLRPETYDGRRVRVRGWLKDWNGPMIEVTHPEQIEIVEK